MARVSATEARWYSGSGIRTSERVRNSARRTTSLARRVLDLHTSHTGADYVAAMRERDEITERVEALFNGVDWLMLPTLPVPTSLPSSPPERL